MAESGPDRLKSVQTRPSTSRSCTGWALPEEEGSRLGPGITQISLAASLYGDPPRWIIRRTTTSEADYRICARLGQPRSGDFWASDRRCAWTRSPDETTPAVPEPPPAGKDASPSSAWDDTLMARLAEGSPPPAPCVFHRVPRPRRHPPAQPTIARTGTHTDDFTENRGQKPLGTMPPV